MVAWLFALLALAALFSLPTSVQGFVGAAGAILVFGASSLPAKHPAAAAAGTLGFQLWVTCGNFVLTSVLALSLGAPLRWGWHGCAGAVLLTATQLFAWPAIQALGAAVGPGLWCGIGMLASFCWGVAVFDEILTSKLAAALGMAGLLLGVAGLYSYGLYGYGLYSYGVYSYGSGWRDSFWASQALPHPRRWPLVGTAFERMTRPKSMEQR